MGEVTKKNFRLEPRVGVREQQPSFAEQCHDPSGGERFGPTT